VRGVPTQAPDCSLELCGSVGACYDLFFFGFFFSRFGAFLFAMGTFYSLRSRILISCEVTRMDHLR
jgi:hypothetical protein